uniref:Murine leukemia virus integrase C-terminal domain-containing protein n=1 Tax=Gopherus agassizii TaxID=38772 RepID=A0A452ILJ7_9SAUR
PTCGPTTASPKGHSAFNLSETDPFGRDWVYVKEWKIEPLQPQWAGPFQVLTTSHTAIRVRERDTWIHHTRIKLAPRPGPGKQTTSDFEGAPPALPTATRKSQKQTIPGKLNLSRD